MQSPVPSYVQLAGQLRARILSGDLAPRTPLPSLKYLQDETGLSVNTIRRAVALLVSEGLAVSVQGRGTYVAER